MTLSVLGGLVLLGGCGALVAVTVSHAPKPRTLPLTEAPQDKAPGKDAPSEEPAVEEGNPAADVKVTKCVVDSLTTWPVADVEIVNHGDSKATYVVNVEFVDGSGTRLGEGLAATDSLAVGQKAKEQAQGLVKVPGKVTCRVSKVTRYLTN
ncbi:FxLYD domain-containing protein [Streptomyces sp. NPDC058232]|uniref:FxLYD domain-containing protein n=1 Tax=unclassified Streptomyces TaxID=2593676 RepID=UPI00339E435F